MTPNIEITNRTLWYAVAAMLAIYIIWVLEDLVKAVRKPTVLIFREADNLIEGTFRSVTEDQDKYKPVDWSKVDAADNHPSPENDAT